MPHPRYQLITQARLFISKAMHLPGVTRIALVGSILTNKTQPKDVDLLLTIGAGVDMAQLAKLSRQLKGRLQGQNLGADVFLADAAGTYLGRTCPWKHCAPGVRARCEAQTGCGRYLYDDLHVVTLNRSLIEKPPLIVWPQVVYRTSVPGDVVQDLLKQFYDST